MKFSDIYQSVRFKVGPILIAVFGSFGIGITSRSNLTRLNRLAGEGPAGDLEFLLTLPAIDSAQLLPLLAKSKSQFRQDLFVLSELTFKREGFFVEFGAANGIDLSNTYLLENEFSWKGILAEPAKAWSKQLRQNRPNSQIEELCVWRESNQVVLFNETSSVGLSTIDAFSEIDDHRASRRSGTRYEVSTISLNDLLKKHDAPSQMDYLSIDTEGSEFEILQALNFDEYSFKVITCEHNFTSAREKIYELLTSNGYERKYEKISQYDDWYVKI